MHIIIVIGIAYFKKQHTIKKNIFGPSCRELVKLSMTRMKEATEMY